MQAMTSLHIASPLYPHSSHFHPSRRHPCAARKALTLPHGHPPFAQTLHRAAPLAARLLHGHAKFSSTIGVQTKPPSKKQAQ